MYLKNKSKKKSLDHNQSKILKSQKKDYQKILSPNKNDQTFWKNEKKQKKLQRHTITKKKIQDLKTPSLIIKINYKGKKLSIPIYQLSHKNLRELVIPHIVKFQHQILNNKDFNPKNILNWKTVNQQNILKDYYIQTGKTLQIFKGQTIELEPILYYHNQTKLQIKDFQMIKCIGTGGFSLVFLARSIRNGKFYALKLVEKQGLFQYNKEFLVANQRDIMVQLNHQRILKLEFTFESKYFIVFGLQYCPGGQLFTYLKKVRRFSEDQAKHYFLQILQGIEYLHSQKIIYRDMKPENILIDLNGNLKIGDFGLSRQGLEPNQLSFTECGSPQYMAPEMLKKQGHTYSIDYYCLGALLYELVIGSPPFYSHNMDLVFYAIQNQQVYFPQGVITLSQQFRSFMKALLQKNPQKRLGSKQGVKQILSHPWIRKKFQYNPQQYEKNLFKFNLLNFNIDQKQIQIQATKRKFQEKLNKQDQNFIPMFQDFYYYRQQQNQLRKKNKIKQKFKKNNIIKKQEKNQRKKLGSRKLTHQKTSQKNKMNSLHYSSTSKDKRSNKYIININNSLGCHKKNLQFLYSAPSKNLKNIESLKQLKNINNYKIKNQQIPLQKKTTKKRDLKRIKSSNALLDYKIKYNQSNCF